jgi:AcrR family transcriptional regulator
MMASRDPARTRRVILAAATAEFCANGLAGARIDAIAVAAGVNKRMLYHYFDSKDGLFAAVCADHLRPPSTPRDAADLSERTTALCAEAATQPDQIRLSMWEALADSEPQTERAAAWQKRVSQLREAQRGGRLRAGIDVAQLELACAALAFFPFAFPQLTRMITGHAPDQPAFDTARSVLLSMFARAFDTASPPSSQSTPAAPPVAAAKPRYRLSAEVTEAPPQARRQIESKTSK